MGRAFHNRCDVSEVSATESWRTLRRQNGWNVGGRVGGRSWEEVKTVAKMKEGPACLKKTLF